MTSWSRQLSATVVVALGCLLCGAEALAQERATLQMVVVIRPPDAIAAAALQESMAVVARIYRQAGVEIAWWHPDRFAATMPADPEARRRFCRRVLVVTLNASEPDGPLADKPGTLGIAAAGSRLASVFVSRVQREAARRRVSFADLLGTVIAHELGHLLLPPGAHSANGLMRASLDFDAIEQSRLWFDRSQSAAIRATVATELHGAAVH